MSERFPSGFACNITLGINDEPLLSLVFLGDDLEVSEIVLTEVEATAVLNILGEAAVRASMLREMITMFPEQRDSILATLMFRWTGEVDGQSS
jgi:hypothetical protein